MSVHEFNHKLSTFSLYFVYLAIGNFIATYISTSGFIYTGSVLTSRLRSVYLSSLLRQNMAIFDAALLPGDVASVVSSSMSLIEDGMSQKIGLMMTGVAATVGALVIAFCHCARLTGVLLSTTITIFMSMSIAGRFIVKFKKAEMSGWGVTGAFAEDIISSIRTVAAFNAQESLAGQFEDMVKSGVTKWGVRVRFVTGIMVAAVMAVIYLQYALGFWEGGRLLLQGAIGVNDIVTVLLAVMLGGVSLGHVAPHIQAIMTAKAAAQKVFTVINRESTADPMSESGERLTHVEGKIELQGITHVYPSRPEVTVMENFNLTIPAGKVTALCGESGCGKSTIIGLLERFYHPVQGKILLDGQDIDTLNLKWLRQQMSLVSQEPVLFKTTIFDNIAYGLDETSKPTSEETRRKLVQTAAEEANAHKFITLLPHGYDTDVGTGGLLLSGGQRQRIALARALISNPRILILDEATSALDTESEGIVQAAMEKASRGRTTIMIAHRLSTIKGADNIVVMAKGAIVEQGTHNDLLSKGGMYKELVERQKLDSNLDEERNGQEECKPLIQRIQTATPGTTAAPADGALTSSSPDQSYSVRTLLSFLWAYQKQDLPFLLIGLFCSIIAGGGMPVQAGES
jgi:ATP-binding cassette, subfamily B (MDR/TAP), member 1